MTRHVYRFFAREVRNGAAVLSEADTHHLIRVLRLRVGDTCEVAAEGRVHLARITEGGLELLEEVRDVAKAPTVTVWIAQPGGRSDEAVEKLTELGVARIGGLVTDLLKGSFTQTRVERWKRVAEAAAKQSKQVQVPEIMGIAKFAEVLSPEAIVLNQDGASGGLADRVVGRRAATLLVGPSPASRTPSSSWRASAASPSPRSGRSFCAPRRRRSWPRR